MTEPTPGRRTPISRDPIGVDPIGNDPLDRSAAPPRKDGGPHRTPGGWLANATGAFTAAIVLAIIMTIVIVLFLTMRI